MDNIYGFYNTVSIFTELVKPSTQLHCLHRMPFCLNYCKIDSDNVADYGDITFIRLILKEVMSVRTEGNG